MTPASLAPRGRGLTLFLALTLGLPAAADPLVDELLPQVVKVMGLPAPKKLKVKEVNRAQAEAMLRKEIDPKANEALGEALLAIGLLPPGTKLELLAPEFHQQNVSGFYDLREHTLVLLSDQPEETRRPIIAHELAHAVQDANVDLAAALKARSGSEDATLAFTAVLEGQAQATAAIVMQKWLEQQHVSVEGMADMFTDTRARSAAEAAESAPVPWLGLQLRFPYVAGRELIKKHASAEDPIARGLLMKPPKSTAEVMDPRSAPPISGELKLAKLIPGSKQTVATTLGRAAIELLGPGLGEGWRGDRLEAVSFRGSVAVVWIVAFESESQAAALVNTLTPTLSRRERELVVVATGAADTELIRRAAFRVLASPHGPDHPAPQAPGIRGK